MVVLSGFLLWNSLGSLSLLAAKVTVASHREVLTIEPIQCIVARNEKVILSPADGNYIPLVDDGTKVRVGQTFAQVEGLGGIVELQAEVAGLVRHGGDGMEGMVPINITLDDQMAKVLADALKKPPVSKVLPAVEGQPVAVIIENVSGYQLLTGLNFHSPGKRRTLKVELENGQKLNISISPQKALQSDNLFWVLWNVPSLPDTLGLNRVFDADIVTSQQQLVLVPHSALYVKDGQAGVFVLYRSKPVFNPVEVFLPESEVGMMGVSGLANGQNVLSLPRWASFAMRWWQK